jgi:hypothetical protein
MRVRSIVVGAIVSGLVGCTGQFLADLFCWTCYGDKAAFQYWTTTNAPSRMNTEFTDRAQAYRLAFLGYLVCWVDQRGETARHTSSVLALLYIVSLLGGEQIRKKREAAELTTGSLAVDDANQRMPKIESATFHRAESLSVVAKTFCEEQIRTQSD